MSKPELTKQLIADTLKKLMLDTPLDKISVQEIVDACGLNRKTFYYHFKDKQDLIYWIFKNELADIADINRDELTVDKLIMHQNDLIADKLVEHMYLNKDFYIAALDSDAQNNLREYLFKIIYDILKTNICLLLEEKLIAPSDLELIVNYFSHAVIGSLTDWAKQGMREPPQEYKKNFVITIECLDFIVNNFVDEYCSIISNHN